MEHARERGLVDFRGAAGASHQASSAARGPACPSNGSPARDRGPCSRKGSQGQVFLASQMQCPNRIERAMTRLRFSMSFIRVPAPCGCHRSRVACAFVCKHTGIPAAVRLNEELNSGTKDVPRCDPSQKG